MNKDERKAWEQFMAAALTGLVGNPECGCNSINDITDYAAKIADSALEKMKDQLK
jgi:hypothetical protein